MPPEKLLIFNFSDSLCEDLGVPGSRFRVSGLRVSGLRVSSRVSGVIEIVKGLGANKF